MAQGIKLGRVPLVATLADDVDEDDTEEKVRVSESRNYQPPYRVDSSNSSLRLSQRWNHHQPNSGKIPTVSNSNSYAFPAMFLYPGAGQSDFVDGMSGDEMVALRLAEMFPEEGNDIPWDYNNEYRCSR